MTEYVLKGGSIYCPGHTVYRVVSERHLVAVATFDNKTDAEEFLAFVQEES